MRKTKRYEVFAYLDVENLNERQIKEIQEKVLNALSEYGTSPELSEIKHEVNVKFIELI